MVAGLLCFSLKLLAQTDEEAVWNTLNYDLSEAQAAYSETVERIDAEKEALLREIENSQSTVEVFQRQWDLLNAKQSTLSSADITTPIRSRIATLSATIAELESFIEIYPQSLHPAETRHTLDIPRPVGAGPSTSALPAGDHLGGELKIIDAAIERLDRLSDHRFQFAEAIYPDGRVRNGEVLQVGPIAFFKPEDREAIGWISHTVAGRPAVDSLLPPSQSALGALFNDRSGMIPIPLDPMQPQIKHTGVDALKQKIQNGGVWMYPIIGFGLIALGCAIIKYWHLRRYYAPPRIDEIEAIMQEHSISSPADLPESVSKLPSATLNLIHKGIEYRNRFPQKAEPMLLREVYYLHPELTRYLPLIAITASVSPLLGLLGTVSGMIETFDVISVHGTRNAQMLSGGISEALGTTEMGLIVAIPALVLHAILSRRVRWLMNRYERIARIVTLSLVRDETVSGM
jgi:biopolymer transport protein ExbB